MGGGDIGGMPGVNLHVISAKSVTYGMGWGRAWWGVWWGRVGRVGVLAVVWGGWGWFLGLV